MLSGALVLALSALQVYADSVYNHLGNLSPYHAASVPQGVSADLPSDCTVEQVMLVRGICVPSLALQ